MNDGETRFHLLTMCNTLRDQLKQTEKLTSAVEMLLARDPELRARYEAQQKKELDTDGLRGPVEPISESILLRLEQEIQALSSENRP